LKEEAGALSGIMKNFVAGSAKVGGGALWIGIQLTAKNPASHQLHCYFCHYSLSFGQVLWFAGNCKFFMFAERRWNLRDAQDRRSHGGFAARRTERFVVL
jgi:hypothetical protein